MLCASYLLKIQVFVQLCHVDMFCSYDATLGVIQKIINQLEPKLLRVFALKFSARIVLFQR